MKIDSMIEALRVCARQADCDDTVCHYRKGQDCVCVNGYIRDAADALENAQKETAVLRAEIDNLRVQMRAVMLELDAAKADLKQYGMCGACKNFYRADGCGADEYSYCSCGFKWRGLQEVQDDE